MISLKALHIILYVIPFFTFSQFYISGKVIDQNTGKPLPFVTLITNEKESAMSSAKGEFRIRIIDIPTTIKFSYIGYSDKSFIVDSPDISNIVVPLKPKKHLLSTINIESKGNAAKKLIEEVISRKEQNSLKDNLQEYSYTSYQKLRVAKGMEYELLTQDTSKVAVGTIIDDAHSFIFEKQSLHQFAKGRGEKEIVMGTRMTGFEEPIYDVNSIQVLSQNPFNNTYTLFDTNYVSPLSKKGLKNYYYKILDTTTTRFPAYVILFQPKERQNIAQLEGLLYIDRTSFSIQKIALELFGELNLKATQEFSLHEEEKLWVPKRQEINIKPGRSDQRISLFGGKIAVRNTTQDQNSNIKNNTLLRVTTNFYGFKPTLTAPIKKNQAAIELAIEAGKRKETYWDSLQIDHNVQQNHNQYEVLDSIVKTQHIERKIQVRKSFNRGYYPLIFIDLDLTYPLKYNNYEGIRTGIGGITNKKLSENYRLEGYLVYGFRDNRFKFGIGGGISLNKDSGSWWNLNYEDDLKELGSFKYLTDRRVYSLFEPRLVNITAFFAHRTWSSSIQHRITPKLLSEIQISFSDIDQIGRYRFAAGNMTFSSYQMAESALALRWTPFSKYFKSPDGYSEYKDGYPKITMQFVQGYKGIAQSDFNYSKLGLKVEHYVYRPNLSSTSFLLEGNIVTNTIPLTHLFHAYPNSPTKEVILQRFSVAGRRSFETMYFNEFYSDRLVTMQAKHTFRPIKISPKTKPELVLITRYALGDIRDKERHQNIALKSLKEIYQESGLEINKLFSGFGLSFAYRYGAYNLPNFEDNIAFKFTFYLKL